MRKFLKESIERLGSHRYWIDRASDVDAVRKAIERLRPRVPVAPLVRVGPAGDGGYLIPDDFDGVDCCISPGVSTETGFDWELAERGIDVHMADASVDGPPVPHPSFHFSKKFLDVFEDESHTRLDSLAEEAAKTSKGDWMLQMDIEGAEWRVLLDASPEVLGRFRIMIIEFHDVRQIFSRFGFDLISATMNKLLKTHHVVHIHPNNVAPISEFSGIEVPNLLEITLYRRDRPMSPERRNTVYPHPLDVDCVPGARCGAEESARCGAI
jgi:hypothetical protein